MKILAVIGQSASGKSDLAHAIARATNSVLLSMDSLSVYKNIDIASAKPPLAERSDLLYFGLDIADPKDGFGAADFIGEYKRAAEFCERAGRDLIIVGGSVFYLKCLTAGLSKIPEISDRTSKIVSEILIDAQSAHAKLKEIDPIGAENIKPNDRYRIEKALLIAVESGVKPSEWIKKNPPKPYIDNIAIFLVERDINELRARIKERVRNMIENGLVNETLSLLKTAPNTAQVFKAIGIKESVDYIKGNIGADEMENLINTHTSQFAKRQKTYINSQFARLIKPPIGEFAERAIKYLAFKGQ